MPNNCSLDRLSPYDDCGVIRCSRSKGLLSDITKYLNLPNNEVSKQNVELGLEIEINESVQRVLRDEGSSSDDLLAVTIIRPSESDLVHETTVALNKEDVKDFIALVERHKTKYHPVTTKKSDNAKKQSKKDRDKEIERKKDTRRDRDRDKNKDKDNRDKDKDNRDKTKDKEKPKREKEDRKSSRDRDRNKEKDHNHTSHDKKDSRSRRESRENRLMSDSFGSRDTVISNRPESRDKSRRKSHSSSKREIDSKEGLCSPHHSSKVSRVHLSTFGEGPKQVYTTINTFDKLKEALPCQNRHRSEKPGVPCVCQNCGIMDVLVQSQKGPVVEFPPLEEVMRQPDQRDKDAKRDGRHRRDKKDSKYQQPGSSNTLDVDILKEINVRINNLEKRLAFQEETAVSKDYLKHVLHKIFTQYKND